MNSMIALFLEQQIDQIVLLLDFSIEKIDFRYVGLSTVLKLLTKLGATRTWRLVEDVTVPGIIIARDAANILRSRGADNKLIGSPRHFLRLYSRKR